MSRLTTIVLALAVSACAAAAPPVSAPLDAGAPHPMLVSTSWLAERLDDAAVVVLHVGREEAAYRSGHVPGARFLPLTSIIVERDGIPNELPEVAALRDAFEAVGVSDGSHVVVYGDLGGLSAGRAFFTLDYLGHDRVSVLDGGIETWRAEGRPLATEPPAVARGSFTPRPRPDRVVTTEWVRQRLDDPGYVLIDARPTPQYTGEDAAGLRPGHIPGAHGIFWRTALVSEEDPRLRPEPELRASFEAAGVAPGRTVVTYCRTGMQASHAYFVARLLGYDVVMYDGSYIEWSAREDLPVARGGR
jgi:thiosulfate/3-mercaptopyruvate sulfurtransferase